ncbi:hypothetical protein FN846DRAFT_996835 [Sphaerosporella brunnea]|uniref:Uncharacterized protein n=1 Tax=Sphaerosporella brunnea TaxID=1250544 RepID=A0A5J5EJR3_9PEZI|nr:hypothetical protein FN846DRAFT_996835 [Sphaerosporella brunnea]
MATPTSTIDCMPEYVVCNDNLTSYEAIIRFYKDLSGSWEQYHASAGARTITGTKEVQDSIYTRRLMSREVAISEAPHCALLVIATRLGGPMWVGTRDAAPYRRHIAKKHPTLPLMVEQETEKIRAEVLGHGGALSPAAASSTPTKTKKRKQLFRPTKGKKR